MGVCGNWLAEGVFLTGKGKIFLVLIITFGAMFCRQIKQMIVEGSFSKENLYMCLLKSYADDR